MSVSSISQPGSVSNTASLRRGGRPQHLDHLAAGAQHVRAEQPARGVRIPRRQGSEDGAVLRHRLAPAPRGGEGQIARALGAAEQPIVRLAQSCVLAAATIARWISWLTVKYACKSPRANMTLDLVLQAAQVVELLRRDLSAASSAATRSMPLTASNRSRMSSSRIGGMRALRFWRSSTRPCIASSLSASRNGVRDTPSRSQSSDSTSTLSGARSPRTISERSRSVARSCRLAPLQPRAVGHGPADAQHLARPAALLLRLHHQLVRFASRLLYSSRHRLASANKMHILCCSYKHIELIACNIQKCDCGAAQRLLGLIYPLSVHGLRVVHAFVWRDRSATASRPYHPQVRLRFRRQRRDARHQGRRARRPARARRVAARPRCCAPSAASSSRATATS